jgi:hypothetical protein
MVTSTPRAPRAVASDPTLTGAVTAAPSSIEPEPPPGDGFVVEWQLAGGAGREW